jgi:hypothetical protein
MEILTGHQLSAVVGETPPNDESFKTSLWWLQRSVALLRPEVLFICSLPFSTDFSCHA